MSIEARPYSDMLQEAWDRFVRTKSRNGCIFHEQNFLCYHPSGRFNDVSLVFVEEEKVVGVLPAALGERDGRVCVVSHPGSSGGGLVYHRRHGLRQVLEMLEQAIEYYRGRGFAALEMRLAEPIFSDPSAEELCYLLWHRGFRIVTREIGSFVTLAAAGWLEFGRKKNGNDIRRVEKLGAVAVRLDSADDVYPLIAQNLKQRHGKEPTHTLEELHELKRRYPERVDFWGVMYEGAVIATVVVFAANERVVHSFYIAQNYDYAKIQVMPLLFQTAFNYYQGKGFQYFNFGISSRGDWIKLGILEFKEHMGGRATVRDAWILDDLQNYQKLERL